MLDDQYLRRLLAGDSGNDNSKLCPLTYHTINPDRSIVLLDNLLHNSKPQTRPRFLVGEVGEKIDSTKFPGIPQPLSSTVI